MDFKKILGLLCLFALAAGAFLWWQGALVGENAALAEKRSVADATGRAVEIPARPQRVVLLNASHLDLYCAAGGAAQVVGKPTSSALSAKVKAATREAREVGVIHSPNVETILALQPDLVVGIDVPFHNALIPLLEKAGVPVLIRSLDTYEEVLETLRFYGELTGDAAAAAKSADAIEAASARAVAARQKERQAQQCLIVWGAAGSSSMATSASFAGDILRRVGGANIADAAESAAGSGFVPLGMEYIAQHEPDVIFLISHSSGAGGASPQAQFADDPIWREVKAVREGRVYALPSALFAVNPGTRIGEAMETMAAALYKGGKV